MDSPDKNAYAGSGEFGNLGLPSIFFIDTNLSKRRVDNGILVNTKTVLTNLFYLHFAIDSYKNVVMFRKKKFFYNLLHFSCFNVFKNIKKAFYFLLFLKKNKRKIIVNFF
jgi:hypothetical protein